MHNVASERGGQESRKHETTSLQLDEALASAGEWDGMSDVPADLNSRGSHCHQGFDTPQSRSDLGSLLTSDGQHENTITSETLAVSTVSRKPLHPQQINSRSSNQDGSFEYHICVHVFLRYRCKFIWTLLRS